MMGKRTKDWLIERLRTADASRDVRKQYEQDWPPPPCAIDPALPKPWLVIGYTRRAVEAVLRNDYGAGRDRDGRWPLPGGEITLVYRPRYLAGYPHGGTLFYLVGGPDGFTPEMCETVDRAMERGYRIEQLKDRHGR